MIALKCDPSANEDGEIAHDEAHEKPTVPFSFIFFFKYLRQKDSQHVGTCMRTFV